MWSLSLFGNSKRKTVLHNQENDSRYICSNGHCQHWVYPILAMPVWKGFFFFIQLMLNKSRTLHLWNTHLNFAGKLQVGRSSPCRIAIWPPIIIFLLPIEINSVSITYLYLGESWKWRHFPSSLRRSKAIKLKDYFRTICPPAACPAALTPFCAITTVGKPRQARPVQMWKFWQNQRGTCLWMTKYHSVNVAPFRGGRSK